MRTLITTFSLCALAALAACGETDLQRGATGAAIGAVAADATGNSPVVGAAIGAAAGATCSKTTPEYCH